MREDGARKEEKWLVWAAKLFVLLVALVGIWAFFRYAFGILLPFLLAWGLGALVYPAAVRLNRYTHLPRALCAVVLLLLLLVLIGLLLGTVADRVLGEIRQLLTRLESDDGALGQQISEWIARVKLWTEEIPLLGRLRRVEELAPILEGVDELVSGVIRQMLSTLSRRIPEWIGQLVRAIPSALIFTVVMLIAGFYFSTQLQAIKDATRAALPARILDRLMALRARLGKLARQYARAYLLILTVTFLELYLAFSILGVEYAFLIAASVALIDILPVFGVGIVLVPWALCLLLGRQLYRGFGLLITYAVVTLVRQILEPRVVSGALGLHPLLTLFCMYGGYRLFGIIGMMLAPALAIFLSGGE